MLWKRMKTMDEAERISGIAAYIVDRIAEAVGIYRDIYRDDRRPAARCVEYLEKRGREIAGRSADDPEEFVEKYRRVLWMTPVEIIMDVLRGKE